MIGGFDTISVVMYCPRGPALADTEVVLVNGWFLPGGSLTEMETRKTFALDGVRGEIGFEIGPERVRKHGSRQVDGTNDTPRSLLLSVRLTRDEMDNLIARRGRAYGIVGKTERTYHIEIRSVAELVDRPPVTDWATLGKILVVLHEVW